MVASLSFASFALAVASLVSASVIPQRDSPTGWDSSLEDYQVYHSRYLTLNCHQMHGKPFFDQCCHPRSASEGTDKKLPAPCFRNGAAASEDATKIAHHDPESASADPATNSANAAVAPKISSQQLAAAAEVYRGGLATWYYQNGNAGACGRYRSDNDLIAALDYRRYGALNRQSKECGRKIRITNTKNRRSVIVTVADACPTCTNSNSIDLSRGAFAQIANYNEGVVPIEWQWL